MSSSSAARAIRQNTAPLPVAGTAQKPKLRLIVQPRQLDEKETGAVCIPPDERTVRRLALIAYEVVVGLRPLAQLTSWATATVLQTLTERQRLHANKQAHFGTQQAVLSPGRAHLMYPCARSLEATVVLHGVHRSCAVALRFELLNSRWRASEITVL